MKKVVEYKSIEDIFNYKRTKWDSFISFIWYRPKRKIVDAFYQIKYAFQRAFRGYDDREIFNLDYEFCKRYLKILEHLKQTHVGHPYNISDNDWETILQEMINHLDYIYTNMFEWENSDSVQKSKDSFMDLFKEYFFDLWN